MQPINVLYLVRTWAFGGSHTIVLSLLEHIPRDRFRIVCVPYDAHSAGDAEFIDQAGARNLEISSERIRWRSNRDWFRARRNVSTLIQEYDISLIHTHDPHSNMLIGIGRNRWPVPVVVSAYGWWDGPLGRRRLHQRIERDFALPNVNRVITVSDDMRNRVLKGPAAAEHVSVVRTGLAPSSPAATGALRDRFNIPRDAVVVGTVGRVSAEKGHRYLIEAAAQLRGDFPNLYFVIAGTGPELDALKRQVKESSLMDRVIFTGFWEDLHSALADMNVFAFPSIEREGLPTAVLEAQQAGLPVVASDIGGTNEALIHGATGILIPPRDTDALAKAIHPFVSDASSRSEMGKAGHDRIVKNFSMNAMIDRISSIYDEVIREYSDAHSH